MATLDKMQLFYGAFKSRSIVHVHVQIGNKTSFKQLYIAEYSLNEDLSEDYIVFRTEELASSRSNVFRGFKLSDVDKVENVGGVVHVYFKEGVLPKKWTLT